MKTFTDFFDLLDVYLEKSNEKREVFAEKFVVVDAPKIASAMGIDINVILKESTIEGFNKYVSLLNSWNSTLKFVGKVEDNSLLLLFGLSLDIKVSSFVNDTSNFSSTDVDAVYSHIKSILGMNEEDGKEEESDEVDPEIEQIIGALINEIMGVYDVVYAPCFENRPFGVLCSQGYLKFADGHIKMVSNRRSKNGKDVVTNPYLHKLWNFIMEFSGNEIKESLSAKTIDTSMVDENGNLLKNYVPVFHVMLAYGLRHTSQGFVVETSWQRYKKDVYKSLRNILVPMFENATCDYITLQSKVKDIFTNVVVLKEFDRRQSIHLVYKFDSIRNLASLGKQITLHAGDSTDGGIFAVGKDAGDERSNDSLGLEVYNYLYVFDKNIFDNDILFAYRPIEKVIKAGGTVDISRTILGRKVNGQDLSVNIAKDNMVSGVIVGQSGSGKGVLTLSVLATVIASGSPFIYLDYKPDMAAVMWDLERKFGSKILSIDSLANRHKFGSTPVRAYPYGYRATEEILDPKEFALIPYLKALQLFMLVTHYRSSGIFESSKKFFAFLDEGQRFNGAYKDFLVHLKTTMQKLKPRKGDTPSSGFTYAEKLSNAFGDSLSSDVSTLLNTTGRQGNVSLFLLGQDGDPAGWGDGVHDWAHSVFGEIVSKCSLKLSGIASGNSTMYGLSGFNCKGIELVRGAKRGYFVKSNGVKSESGGEVFKSYMVLLENDYESQPNDGSVAKLLANVESASVRTKLLNEDVYNNGVLNQRLGFVGLIEYLAKHNAGTDFVKTLDLGYEICEKAMNKARITGYSCVEEYLYDCSVDSIFTLGQLVKGLEGKENESGQFKEEDFEGVSENAQGFTTPSLRVPVEGISHAPNVVESEPVVTPSDKFEIPSGILNEDGSVPEGSASEGFNKGVPNVEEQEQEDVPINERTGFGNENDYQVYDKPLEMRDNPYEMYGSKPTPLQMMNTLDSMSAVLLKTIEAAFGSLNRIEKFEVTGDGCIILNDVYFKPQFPEGFVDTIPFDLRRAVSKRNYIELFNLRDLRKFVGLTQLAFEDVNFAETRVRPELGLRSNDSWVRLFSKMWNLRIIKIGGSVFDKFNKSDDYESNRSYQGFKLSEKLRNTFQMPSVSNSRMGKFYQSKHIPVWGKVALTVGGVAGMFALASFLGLFALPIGIMGGSLLRKK